MPKFSYPLLAAFLLICLMADASARGIRITAAETPAENVRKSQWYDYLLSVSAPFRTYRIRKECNPITFSVPLRQDCVVSFDTYEPIRPGYH